ncbi:SusC/RagA family TonB-linked outer membrane protein [Moheibacter sediminis]|nr:SusC/RagA family TonB-linked outer membrane protein [Moheibacter sediminis]
MKIFKKLMMVCMLVVPIWLAAQTTVNGVISEQGTGFSLSDVTVTNESTLEETFADMDGNFTIQAHKGDRLVFSLDGYDDVIVNYNNESSVNVVMRTGSTYQLDDVVVIGYGTTTHKDATGSMVAVTEKDFNQGLNTAPEQLLTGKVAGLQINTAGGAPGTGSQIRIRGGSSINASSDPLFVVDGVPMDNGTTVAGSSNPLNYINPSDIESISVLKDASATAIYGARASNGVIIITTKRGKKGKKLGINFNSTVSVSERMNQVDVLSADEFRNAVMQRGSESVQALLGNSNTNWQDEIFKTALGYDNNLGITGMITDNLPFRISLGYTNQDGILKTGNFERTTASISLTPSLFDNHLTIDINARGSYEENRFADAGAIGNAIRMDPTQSVYADSDRFGGYWEWLLNGVPNVNSNRNPLAMLMMKQDLAYVRRSVGNIKFDYKVHGFEDLTATLNLGYDYSDSNGKNLVSDSAALSYAAGGINKDYKQIRRNNLFDFYLNYNKEIPSIKSKIDVTAGYSYQSFDYDNYEINQNFRRTKENPETYYDINTRVLIGFFGRLNYTFNEKYLLTATIRRDGSSRFSKDTRWGWFPSLAAAWNVADENFLKDSKTVSNLKLRLGWGITGQENLGGNPYPYLPIYMSSTNQYAYYPMGNDNFVPILRPNIYDPYLKWEEQTTWNIGLDFGFFNNRMWGSVDFYKKITDDMLQTVAAPLPNLNNQITTNIGSMENQGVELALGGDIIRTTDLTWTLNANATYNENVVTSISGGGNQDFYTTGGISGGIGNNVQVIMVGAPAGSFYVYEQVYDQNGSPIQGAYVDRNGDGIINEEDLRAFHSGRPDWTLGLNSNLTYKNWDFGFSMRASLGNYNYNNVASDIGTYAGLIGTNGFLSNVQSDALDTGFITNEYFSDYYVQNASFLRMDYLTLGYTFHKVFGKTDIRFNGTVQNVFVITDYDGLDPEIIQTNADPRQATMGIDNNFYPRPRIFSLGVNVNF